MADVKLTKTNETWLRIECEKSILFEMSETFKFLIPNHKFHPKVKAKVWDGYIQLIFVSQRRAQVGMFSLIVEFCKKRGYSCEWSDSLAEKDTVTSETLSQFINSLKLSTSGKPIELRDYQIDAVLTSLNEMRGIILSSTGSGKSAIIYAICRYLELTGLRILLVVPTVSLVTQMTKDFEDYATNDTWSTTEKVHMICAGKDKNTRKPITISTWQSLHTIKDSDYFEQFDVLLVDETHLASAASISAIVEKSINAKYKLGFTGSLQKSKTHEMALTAMFGSVKRVSSTRDLIDKGHLSDIVIKSVVLKYPDEMRKACAKMKYADELDFIVRNPERLKFVVNLAGALKGNTLILFNFVEKHGKVIRDFLQKKFPEKQVCFISGEVDAVDRNDYRTLMEENDNVIIIASFGTTSTGVSIKRLNNIISASPTKSVVRVLQSIGRGLRTAHDKTVFTWYDIADDLRWKSHENHTYKHFVERLKIYAEEQFEYKIVEVQLKGIGE